jgi:hypothetical protein
MTWQNDDEYNRPRLALYLTGLLPDDPVEAKAVLDLCEQLAAVAYQPKDQRPREGVGTG